MTDYCLTPNLAVFQLYRGFSIFIDTTGATSAARSSYPSRTCEYSSVFSKLQSANNHEICSYIVYIEEFEYTNGIIRIRKSKRDRQWMTWSLYLSIVYVITYIFFETSVELHKLERTSFSRDPFMGVLSIIRNSTRLTF